MVKPTSGNRAAGAGGEGVVGGLVRRVKIEGMIVEFYSHREEWSVESSHQRSPPEKKVALTFRKTLRVLMIAAFLIVALRSLESEITASKAWASENPRVGQFGRVEMSEASVSRRARRWR